METVSEDCQIIKEGGGMSKYNGLYKDQDLCLQVQYDEYNLYTCMWGMSPASITVYTMRSMTLKQLRRYMYLHNCKAWRAV